MLWFTGMNETLVVSMLPVVANTLLCEVPIFSKGRMPRVVPDQREKFENDELFRKLSRESEVYQRCADLLHTYRLTCIHGRIWISLGLIVL